MERRNSVKFLRNKPARRRGETENTQDGNIDVAASAHEYNSGAECIIGMQQTGIMDRGERPALRPRIDYRYSIGGGLAP